MVRKHPSAPPWRRPARLPPRTLSVTARRTSRAWLFSASSCSTVERQVDLQPGLQQGRELAGQQHQARRDAACTERSTDSSRERIVLPISSARIGTWPSAADDPPPRHGWAPPSVPRSSRRRRRRRCSGRRGMGFRRRASRAGLPPAWWCLQRFEQPVRHTSCASLLPPRHAGSRAPSACSSTRRRIASDTTSSSISAVCPRKPVSLAGRRNRPDRTAWAWRRRQRVGEVPFVPPVPAAPLAARRQASQSRRTSRCASDAVHRGGRRDNP